MRGIFLTLGIVSMVFSGLAGAGEALFASTVTDSGEAGGCTIGVQVMQAAGTPGPTGLLVRVRSLDGVDHEKVWRASNGPLVFEGVSCGAVRIEAGVRVAVGRRFATWEALDLLIGKEGLSSPVVLTIPPSGVVRARVVDGQGNDVPTGTVVAEREGGGAPDDVGQWTSDIAPDAQARLVLPAGGYSLRLQSVAVEVVEARRNGELSGTPVLLEVVPGRPTDVEFRVGDSPLVRGRVVDEDGEGVPGVEVRAFAAKEERERTGQATTDDRGEFRLALRELPARLAATIRHGSLVVEPRSIDVSSGEAAPLTFHARSGSDSLVRGRVVTYEGETPVAGARVVARPKCSRAPGGRLQGTARLAMTAADGSFSFPCDPRCPVQFLVRKDPLRQLGSVNGSSIGSCSDLHMIQAYAPGVIRGRVVDGDGNPMTGYVLEARSGSFTRATGMTDADGKFQLNGLPAGEYRVEPGAGDAGAGVVLVDAEGRRAAPILDRPGAVLDLALRLAPGGPLCVEVALDSGEKVPLETLEVFTADSEEVVASAVGSYSVLKKEPHRLCSPAVPAGKYRLRVDGAHFLPAWWSDPDGGASKTVRVGNEVATVEMIVAPAGRMMIDLPGWDPNSHDVPTVEVRRADEGDGWRTHPEHRVRLNKRYRLYRPAAWRAAPRFVVTELPAGRWNVRACAGASPCDEEREGPVWSTGSPVEIGGGKEERVRLRSGREAGDQPPS